MITPYLTEDGRIKNSHPDFFIRMLGGIEEIKKIPLYDIGEQMGATQYLDFPVALDDLPTPVVRGFDKYGRGFYFAKIKQPEQGFQPDLLRIFQRYNNSKMWILANGDQIPAIRDASQEYATLRMPDPEIGRAHV